MSKEQHKEKIIEIMTKLTKLYEKTNEPELKIKISLCILEFYKAVFNC